jgi:hypothetical protein
MKLTPARGCRTSPPGYIGRYDNPRVSTISPSQGLCIRQLFNTIDKSVKHREGGGVSIRLVYMLRYRNVMSMYFMKNMFMAPSLKLALLPSPASMGKPLPITQRKERLRERVGIVAILAVLTGREEFRR